MGTSSETVQPSTRLYRRELPGAGYVAIDVTHMDDATRGGVAENGSRVRLFVERRADQERRAGHQPPIVAEFTGNARSAEVGELYRMAADNAALARALIEWQGRRQRKPTGD